MVPQLLLSSGTEHYLGTSDAVDLVIATNAIEAIRIGNSALAAGSVTIANGFTVSAGGATVTAGGLEVSAGGAAITGNSSVTGDFDLAGTASALLLNNSGGTSGRVLVSQGGGKTPIWGSISSVAWGLGGNGGTTPGTGTRQNYLGTTDPQDLVITTNATERIRVDTNGNVGIGTNDPKVLLDVDGGLAIRSPSEINITQDNTTVDPGDRSFLRIDSDGTPGNRTITLAAGKKGGQILVIQCTATGTDGIELLTSASTHTFTNNKTLQGQDNVYVLWDEDNGYWLEISHTDF